MKKFVSLLLAALMLLSMTAMAAVDTRTSTANSDVTVDVNSSFGETITGNGIATTGDTTLTGTNDVTHVEAIGEASHFDQSEVTNQQDTTEEYASQKTDVWLQVDASGQIDITVPLVVVFKTNIDGGKADTADNYNIYNYSSAGIKVTRVEIEDQYVTVATNGDSQIMEPVLSTSLNRDEYDQYSLLFEPADNYKTDSVSVEKEVFDWTSTGNDKKTYSIEADENQKQGLWLIDKEVTGDTKTPGISKVLLTLETSRLSFVTKDEDTDSSGEHGIKLFTIVYTVQIDDSEAKGDVITGSDGTKYGDLTMTYTYAGDAKDETEYTDPSASTGTP